MQNTILIVDDNQEMLLSLKDGLEQYDSRLAVQLAGNGLKALDLMETQPINLVVADLKMPRMDGLTLLGHLSKEYPDVPVIIMTAYGTPETERMARAGGAEDFLEKPFLVVKLARKIAMILESVSDGGSLNDVSPTMFIQLIEVEQKTCTVRVTHGGDQRQGVLFFRNGELVDARLHKARGREAALKLLAWDQVGVNIQNHCPIQEQRITQSVQSILLESMHLKDETPAAEDTSVALTPEPLDGLIGEMGQDEPEVTGDAVARVQTLLEEGLGRRSGVRRVYADTAWDSFMERLSLLGDVFDAGELQLMYLNTGAAQDFIIIPEAEPVVVAVDSKCPRDRIMQLLHRE